MYVNIIINKYKVLIMTTKKLVESNMDFLAKRHEMSLRKAPEWCRLCLCGEWNAALSGISGQTTLCLASASPGVTPKIKKCSCSSSVSLCRSCWSDNMVVYLAVGQFCPFFYPLDGYVGLFLRWHISVGGLFWFFC